jgi:hypothetical protein
MAEQYGMKNEMLDVLRKKLLAWEHIKNKAKMKNPSTPLPNPKETKTCSPDCMLSLHIGSHESFILKTVDHHLQLGLIPIISLGYVLYYLCNFDTNFMISEMMNFLKIIHLKDQMVSKELEESSAIFYFRNENSRIN